MKSRDAKAERILPVAVVAAVVCAALAGCPSNPYLIGGLCPPDGAGVGTNPRCPVGGGAGVGADAGVDAEVDAASDGGAGITFAVDFSHSGVSDLDDHLVLPSGSFAATLRLRGESATATAWTTEGGAVLAPATGAPTPGVGAPFKDETRAVELASDAPSYAAADGALGAVGSDDFALEVVLRAAAGTRVLDKRAGATGWSLQADATGVLGLVLQDAAGTTALIASEPLVEGAWYHCIFWNAHAAGARADCDGRAGEVTTVGLGSLDAATPAALGGGARARVALVALYRVPPGGLGDPSTWLAVAGQRFAALTGVLPRVAHGTLLPRPGERASPAYVDLQAAAGAPRRLFLVGPDWPRVACRTDGGGTWGCGYLSEPTRARVVPADAAAWQAGALAVVPDPGPVVDGAPRLGGLVPSTANAAHVLSVTGAFGASSQAFSFFVRAAAPASVGVGVGAAAPAVFDVAAGAVVSAPPGVHASIEPWGNGLFRCACVFDSPTTPVTYSVHLLGPGNVEPFAGDGATANVALGGLQVEVAQRYPGSLLAADAQAGDRLTFVANDGNLPMGTIVGVDLQVALPAGPRQTLVPPDQAVVNLNRGATFADQVQLFVTGDGGKLKFWGISGGMTHWTFDNPTSLVDGSRHLIHAAWSVSSAQVTIDGVSQGQTQLVPSPAAFALDRIDVGFSTQSSGALEGLVSGLQLAGPP